MRAATWSSYFFPERFFFKVTSYLKQLLLSNKYFLVTNTVCGLFNSPEICNLFSCTLLCLQIIPEISKIKKRNQRRLYFTFNALLKYFNSFGVKPFPAQDMKRCYLQNKVFRNYSRFLKGLSGYYMVLTNDILALTFTRKIL